MSAPRQQITPVTAASACPRNTGIWGCDTSNPYVKSCVNRTPHVPTFVPLCDPSYVEPAPCNCAAGASVGSALPAAVATRNAGPGQVPRPMGDSSSMSVIAPLVEATKAAAQQKIARPPVSQPKAKEAFEDGTPESVVYEDDYF